LEKVLDIYKYHFAKVCSETAQPQKSQFFMNTLYLHAQICACLITVNHFFLSL
jgi:hypothetical protein